MGDGGPVTAPVRVAYRRSRPYRPVPRAAEPTNEERWHARRWLHLARFEARQKTLIGWHRLGDCAECPGGDRCRRRKVFPPPLNVLGWPACPVSLLRSEEWQVVVRVYNASRTAPLDGWPLAWPAWLVDAVGLLDREVTLASREAA